MKLHRKSFLFIALTILILVLAACGGDKKTSGDNEGNNNQNNEQNEGNNEGNNEVEDDGETYDLGGRTIKLNFHADMTPQEGTETGDLAVQKWKEVEEKYNVTIEWTEIPYDEKIDHLTTTVLAGEPFADLVRMDPSQAAGLAQEELILPLDDFIDMSQSKMSEPAKESGRVNPDGKVYMMDTLRSFSSGGGMFYNKTMFENAGLEDPYDLVQKGEWTWEAMLDAAKALTTGDQYGMAADPNTLTEYLILSNDTYILDTETGEVVMDNPHTIEALEFMADLYNVHNVIKTNNRSSNWEDPPVFFNEVLVGMLHGESWESSEERQEAPFEWGYVYWPIGPNATEYGALKKSGGGYTIPVGVEDPEIVYQIWEDLQIWEYERESEVSNFENIFPNQESVDIATQMLDNVKESKWKLYNLHDAFYGTFDAIMTGDESPAQAVAKVKPEAQARVDEFLGK